MCSIDRVTSPRDRCRAPGAAPCTSSIEGGNTDLPSSPRLTGCKLALEGSSSRSLLVVLLHCVSGCRVVRESLQASQMSLVRRAHWFEAHRLSLGCHLASQCCLHSAPPFCPLPDTGQRLTSGISCGLAPHAQASAWPYNQQRLMQIEARSLLCCLLTAWFLATRSTPSPSFWSTACSSNPSMPPGSCRLDLSRMQGHLVGQEQRICTGLDSEDPTPPLPRAAVHAALKRLSHAPQASSLIFFVYTFQHLSRSIRPVPS
jgi:hypothetical protein